MNPKSILALTLAALLSLSSFAEKPGDKSLSQADLLRQIESLTPDNSAAGKTAGAPGSLLNSGLGDAPIASAGKKDKALKKSKGPTEITALEATFDQKTNLAVFIGEVVVKDPEFNVVCDKLTAYLKSDKTKGKADAPKPVPPGPGEEAPKKSGGLEKAVAESTGDRRVIITQDKTEVDGSVTQSIGKADKATYDAVTGDVVLTGSPEVLQGINRVVAVDPGTVMTLNRDGRMRANGLTKSTIVDKAGAGL